MQEDNPGLFTETRTGCKIPYFTVRKMKKKYPDQSFIIIGEIGSMTRPPTDGDRLCAADGTILPILPRGSLIKPFERVVGYTAVQSDHYVAVVGGLFHMLMCMVRAIKQIRGKNRRSGRVRR